MEEYYDIAREFHFWKTAHLHPTRQPLDLFLDGSHDLEE
jgi:hypothetical protein